jgi:Flp pilus assembly protein TadD
MLNPNFAGLDQSELLHLALQAARVGDAGNALALFKEATARGDASALAFHGLGAQYAHARMYEQAAVAMRRALELAPGLHAARVQLGLLHLTMATTGQARSVLEPLLALGDDQSYRAFGLGLLALAEDRLAEAATLLRQGAAMEEGALSEDMLRLAAATEEAQSRVGGDEGASAAESQHILLSAYTGYRH